MTNTPHIKRGSLRIIEAFNGYYLYGAMPNELNSVCLGGLGDGTDRPPTLDDMPEWEWAEAYGFTLVNPVTFLPE